MHSIVALFALTIASADAPEKPSTERKAVGKFTSSDAVLLRGDREGWSRIAKDGVVYTGEPIISLAGYKSEIKLDNNVGLILRGELPEARQLPLLESAVSLHHSTDRDIDLTVHRGRVFLTNHKEKGAVTARLRFRDQVWELTLAEPETMVGFEVMPVLQPGEQMRVEDPLVLVALYVAKGKASLKADGRTFGDLSAPPGRSMVNWDNRGGKLQGPHSIDKPVGPWNVDPGGSVTLTPYMEHLEAMAGQFAKDKAKVDVVLLENARSDDPRKRVLGMRGLAAINSIVPLLELLAQEGKGSDAVRRDAAGHLRQTLARGAEQSNLLYDRKKKTGLLVDRGFKPLDAEMVVDLLYPLPKSLWTERETFDLMVQLLKHEKLEVRQLAHQQLLFLAPREKIDFNPAGTAEERTRGYSAWKKLLDAGKLPPASDKP